MANKNNPFTFSFGERPDVYISRYEAEQEVIQAFTSPTPASRSYIIEGVRGSGKTVLMTNIAEELENHKDWVIVNLSADDDLVHMLTYSLKRLNQNTFSEKISAFSISCNGMGVEAKTADAHEEDVFLLRDELEKIKRRKQKLLITIDEVRKTDALVHFASVFQILVREKFPIFVLMTGLYENIDAVQNDPILTFLLRTPKIRTGKLSLLQISKCYRKIFGIGRDEAEKLTRLTKGYAFAFQALGRLYFDLREEMPLDMIVGKLDERLDDCVYKKIWSGLSPKDRDVIRCIQDDKEVAVQEIYTALKMSSQSFSVYRSRLKNKGIIDTSRYGVVSLTLPHFREITDWYD